MRRYCWLFCFVTACAELHPRREAQETQDAEMAVDAASPEPQQGSSDPSPTSIDSGGAAWVDAGLDTRNSQGCTRQPSDCALQRSAMDVTGTSPKGELKITSAHVSYESGLGLSTSLTFLGTEGGSPFLLRLAHRADNEAWPAGSYRANTDPNGLGGSPQVWYYPCAGTPELLQAEVVIFAHQLPDDAAARMQDLPIRLEGELRVSSPGWSLQLPFNLSLACTYRVLLI